jgi:hypothetical protein
MMKMRVIIPRLLPCGRAERPMIAIEVRERGGSVDSDNWPVWHYNPPFARGERHK